MTDEEKGMYGLRSPRGYKKQSILGRGGCALVWLGVDELTGEKVAIKQFPKMTNGQPSLTLDSGYREL